ncbi:Uncharacterised protein [Vibrio cholerae]|nr:Uncharacterised protein [Vibrio cholerae]
MYRRSAALWQKSVMCLKSAMLRFACWIRSIAPR